MSVAITIILLLAIALCVFIAYKGEKRSKQTEFVLEKHNGLLNEAVRYTETVYYNLNDKRVYNAYGSGIPKGGLSLEEVKSFCHPDDFQPFYDLTYRIVAGEKDSDRTTFRWRRKDAVDDEWTTFRAFFSAEKDKKGRVERVFYALYDVTEDIEQRKGMQKESWIFQQVYVRSAAGQAFYAPDGKIVRANPMMEHIYGQIFDLSTLKDLNFFELEPMEGNMTPEKLDEMYVCTRFARRDGLGDIYLEIRAFPMYSNDGELMFLGTNVIDVTQSRDIYLEARRKQKALNEENTRQQEYVRQFSHLLYHGGLMMWHVDWDKNRYILSKDFFHEYEGADIDKFADTMADDSRQAYLDSVAELRAGVDMPKRLIVHVKAYGKQHTDRWLSLTGISTGRDEKGRMCYFGMQRDVTDIILVENQLKAETERANNSSKTKGMFLANMSHEIRTPLNSIVGFSELLDSVEGEEKQEFVNIIRRNSEILLRLISDILELSTAAPEGLPSYPRQVDFAKAFTEVFTSLQQRLNIPNVALVMDNPYSSLNIRVDVDRMQQIITNFANNASKYTKEGHIKLGYRYDDGELYLYCEDTGVGIPEDKQDVIFDRFVKLDSFVQGTGLGLSICKAIAKGCHGDIGVDSTVGEGSTFWFKVKCV